METIEFFGVPKIGKSLIKSYILSQSSYANFLKLDSDLIINNFKMQTSFYNKKIETELKRPLDENITFSFFQYNHYHYF